MKAAEYRALLGVQPPRSVKARRLRNDGPLPTAQTGDGWVEFLVPVRVTSALNAREHHMARARRVRAEHEATTLALTATREGREALAQLQPPLMITLTAITPRAGDDDNRVGGLKGVRDAIASVLGVDDGDERITWVYGKPERGKYAARARIEARS